MNMKLKDYKERLIQIVIDQYQKGWSVPEIAEEFRLNESTIYKWFEKRDVHMKKSEGAELSEKRQELILEMFEHGFSAKEIARLLGHKVATVKNYIVELYMGEK